MNMMQPSKECQDRINKLRSIQFKGANVNSKIEIKYKELEKKYDVLERELMVSESRREAAEVTLNNAINSNNGNPDDGGFTMSYKN